MRNRILTGTILGYLAIPFIILLIGWFRWYISIPVCIIIVYCCIRITMDKTSLIEFKCIRKDIEKIVIILLLCLLWVYLSGIGGFVFQNDDHFWRNGIFNILVNEKWPVTGVVDMDGVMVERGLNYYIGFWMPSAVIGKVFGLQAGYIFQVIWAVLGIMLVYICICSILNKVLIWPFVVLIFFSGLDIIGYFFKGTDLSIITSTWNLEWWNHYQFSSFTTQLFWVFNQALPIWLITFVIYLQKSNKYCIFLIAFTILNGTIPFIGLIPFVVVWMIMRKYHKTEIPQIKKWIKDTFTLVNVLGGGVVGILSFLFVSGSKKGEAGVFFVSMNRGTLLQYILFLLVETAVYIAFVYVDYKKDINIYIIIICLCLCPLFEVGSKNGNLCMRASIPALLILYVYVIKSFDNFIVKKRKILLTCLIIVLVIGASTPIHEIVRTTSETYVRSDNKEQFIQGAATKDEILANRFESTDINDSIYYKYIAK